METKALLWQGFFALAMFGSTFVCYILPIVIFARRNRRLNEINEFIGEEDIQQPHHWSSLNHLNEAAELKRIRLKRILSYCNCVSAGVFLGVCFLNLIPIVENEFSQLIHDFDSLKQFVGTFPLGQFSVVCGLFLVLILESLLSSCFHKPDNHQTNPIQSSNTVPILYLDDDLNDTTHGVNEQEELLLANETENNVGTNGSVRSKNGPTGTSSVTNHNSTAEHDTFNVSQQQNHGHYHSHNPEIFFSQKHDSMLSFFILMFATSIHSLFEGLALGLQSDISNAIHLFIGIILHECLVALALGLNAVRLQQQNIQMKMHFKFAFVFSMTIPVGNILGILLGYTPGHFGQFISAIFQGFAAGTFIHVTFLELIPEEFLSNDCDNEDEEKLSKVFHGSSISVSSITEPLDANLGSIVDQESTSSNHHPNLDPITTINNQAGHSHHPGPKSNHNHHSHKIKLRKIMLLLVGFLLMAIVPFIFSDS